jgi:hypothetical protein
LFWKGSKSILASKKERERRPPEMKEMIARGRVERMTGDRTGRPHYVKKTVEFR